MNELTKYIINSVMLLTVWSVALIVAIHYATKPTPAISPALAPIEQTQKPVDGKQTIDTNATTCRSQNMDGWSRIRTSEEDYVNAMVTQGRAVKIFAQTLTCTDISKNPLLTIHLREPWWQKAPKTRPPQPAPAATEPRGGQGSYIPTYPLACGDYTRPDVPWPVVVGV